jgi:hypothetical protein
MKPVTSPLADKLCNVHRHWVLLEYFYVDKGAATSIVHLHYSRETFYLKWKSGVTPSCKIKFKMYRLRTKNI